MWQSVGLTPADPKVVAKGIRFATADEEVIFGTMKAKDNAVGFLGAVMEPLGRCLNSESARRILNVRAGPAAVRRLAQLARKCDQGRLTPEEQAEYQLYVEVGDLVAVLQAKARRVLAGRTSV